MEVKGKGTSLRQMDYLMHEAAGISRRAISENTEKTYQSLLKRYSDGLSRIPDAPPAFPVTAQSIITYLTFRKTMEHCSLNTIKGDLSAIRRYLHINQLPDVTQSTLVREFMTGMRHVMPADPPFRKLPILPEHLNAFAQRIKSEDDDDAIMYMTMMAVSFQGFLRISELLGLGNKDVQVHEDALQLTIRRSKTDQNGEGQSCFIKRTEKRYDSTRWLELYSLSHDMTADEPLFPVRPQEFRTIIKEWLTAIGVPNVTKYSAHSLRRGGAAAAARAGLEDSWIQRHGRWRSWCFVKYTEIERREAGMRITAAI